MKIKILMIGKNEYWPENYDGVNKINFNLIEKSTGLDFTYLSLVNIREGNIENKNNIFLNLPEDDVSYTKIEWIFSGKPFIAIKSSAAKQLAREIDKISDKYDVIHFSSLAFGEVVGMIQEKHKVFFSAIDSLSLYFIRRVGKTGEFFKRFLFKLEIRRAVRWERKAYKKSRLVHFVSSVDEEHVKRLELAAHTQTLTIPNGVDLEEFSPSADSSCRKRKRLIFVGNFGYGPNQDAANFLIRKVMPLLVQVDLGYELVLVGKGTENLSSPGNNVKFLGFVNDLAYELSISGVFVSPIFYGAGIKNKVLEALACGLPVLGSTVSFEGIGENYNIINSESPEDWRDEIISINESYEFELKKANSFSVATREKFSWSSVFSMYKEAYNTIK